MTTDVTLQAVFAKRAEQWSDNAPLSARLCQLVADDLELAAPLEDVAGDPGHSPVWSQAHRFIGLITHLLRGKAYGHPLTEYWPTLGGSRPIDDELAEIFTQLCRGYRAELTALAARFGAARQNPPATSAMLWPGIAWAASGVGGPIALLELGAAAGTCLYPDRYGYRYSGKQYRGGERLMLDGVITGDIPDFLGRDVDVVARVGLDYEPIRGDDAEQVGWLRDCVFPDNVEDLNIMDKALSSIEVDGIDWRTGDFMTTLPQVLKSIPTEVTPIVYGAHTLCCAEGARELPQLLADSRRNLVWIAKEHADNALGLVSDAAGGYVTEDAPHPPILLSAVTYRQGSPSQAWVLGEFTSLTELKWGPQSVNLSPNQYTVSP